MFRGQRTLAGFLLVVSVGAAGIALLGPYIAKAHETLPVYGRVPAFSLVDQDGKALSRDTLQGRVWIADFIFTRCAGQCPMMSAQMARLSAALPRRGAVRLVSFTVDPTWDTPPVLAQYAKTYGASPAVWSFVTGDTAQLRRLCREGFRLAVAEGAGTVEEPITHSVRLVLVDRAGDIRGYYDAADAGALKRLQRDLRKLL